MSTILVTGAFGNVGRSVLSALDSMGVENRAFEYPSRANKHLAKTLFHGTKVIWGDIRDPIAVAGALEGIDAVIHLAAIIPPEADRNPLKASQINIGGTKNILAAVANSPNRTRLVFSSSVATYGDRVQNFFIRTDDRLTPCADDEYAKQKVACESLIRASSADWVICRLSYIVWKKKLAMDPLMYRMPLDTRLEVCHTLDTGLALANAALRSGVVGKTFNLAGGERCRTSYREYLDHMLRFFGLGGVGFMPEEAFSAKGYHCGYMDTEEAQLLLNFQRHSLADYYKEVAAEARPMKFWAWLCRPTIRAVLLAKSPYLRAYLAEQGKRAILHPARSASIGK